MAGRIKQSRNDSICTEFIGGKTTGELAKIYGISPQRICQILADNNVSASQGGRAVTLGVVKQYHIERDRCYMKKHGITYEDFKRLRKEVSPINGHIPFNIYRETKRALKRKGVKVDMTFPDWWSLWEKSGLWKHYGNRDGQYVMVLKPRCHIFKVGNVEIIEFRSLLTRGIRQTFKNSQ